LLECVECGSDTEGDVMVCTACASTNTLEVAKDRGEHVTDWVMCPLCDGSTRCFYCSAGGPCYHCSGSGREQPGSTEECHVCGGNVDLGKGCAMCGYTRACKHCDGTGKVPGSVMRR
jgi:hypothetical protein